jgi:hypothetical protein
VFCERISTIRSAIDNFGLRDLPPMPLNNVHNASVRVVRNGLAVQTFNTLEDFLRARMGEALASISQSSVQFANLPPALQKASTIDVISAIQFQLKLQEVTNRVAFTQANSRRIGTTVNPPLDLPNLAFFHSSANISHEHFRDGLKAFSVKDPWAQVAGLFSRWGVSAVPGETLFHELANRRHKAAHEPTASVSEVDLRQSLRDAATLAAGFDILLSHCLRKILLLNEPPSPSTFLLTDHKTIAARFIRYSKSRYGEKREGAVNFFRRAADPDSLIPGARARAARESGALLIFDASGNLNSWDLP